MTDSEPTPEALAQARDELGPDAHELCVVERATVIELQRECERWKHVVEVQQTDVQSYHEREVALRTELATERQRASDLEKQVDVIDTWLGEERQRAEAAEAENKALGDHLYVIAEKLGVGSATIPLAVEILKNSMKGCSDRLQVSEAKRKALRSACEDAKAGLQFADNCFADTRVAIKLQPNTIDEGLRNAGLHVCSVIDLVNAALVDDDRKTT